MKLILSVVSLILTSVVAQADLKGAKTVSSNCVQDFASLWRLSEKDAISAKSKDDMEFVADARKRATKLFKEIIGEPLEVGVQLYKPTWEGAGAYVWVCDDETEFEQGNCGRFYFSKDGKKAKLLAVIEEWHIGEGKAYLACEK